MVVGVVSVGASVIVFILLQIMGYHPKYLLFLIASLFVFGLSRIVMGALAVSNPERTKEDDLR